MSKMEGPDSSISSEHRQVPRYRSQREASLRGSTSMLDATASFDDTLEALTLLGSTYNISEDGLALILPSFPLDEQFCMDEERTLQIELQLPKAPITIHANPVHCQPLDQRA